MLLQLFSSDEHIIITTRAMLLPLQRNRVKNKVYHKYHKLSVCIKFNIAIYNYAYYNYYTHSAATFKWKYAIII